MCKKIISLLGISTLINAAAPQLVYTQYGEVIDEDGYVVIGGQEELIGSAEDVENNVIVIVRESDDKKLKLIRSAITLMIKNGRLSKLTKDEWTKLYSSMQYDTVVATLRNELSSEELIKLGLKKPPRLKQSKKRRKDRHKSRKRLNRVRYINQP